jgi:hypothetical protein
MAHAYHTGGSTRTGRPVTAVCKTCGRAIRCDRWLLSDWRHITLEP